MHSLWTSIVHLLRNLHFTWQVDAGIAVTVVSGIRYLVWRGRIHLRHSGDGWIPVNGRILSGEVKDLPSLKQWVVSLTYSYFVGEFRSGQYSLDVRKRGRSSRLPPRGQGRAGNHSSPSKPTRPFNAGHNLNPHAGRKATARQPELTADGLTFRSDRALK
jgi:hypothetical protein